MEFLNTDWLRKLSNLIIIGPAEVGKTHIAISLCHDAIIKGHQIIFYSKGQSLSDGITLFALIAKLSRTNHSFSLIEYYSKLTILCIDELGYVALTKKQADHLKKDRTGYINHYHKPFHQRWISLWLNFLQLGKDL